MLYKHDNRINYIHIMNNTTLDFSLLQVFQALMRERQVTRVASVLGLSQPSISRSLARLRTHFDDPLFVRTQRAMEPTPCALEVAPVVDELLNLYHAQLTRRHSFDPAVSRRTFRIAASEVGHMMLLPRIVPLLETAAPQITLEALPLGLGSLISQLESGEADIAFGAYPKLYAGIHERPLYAEQYACLVREDHPTIGRKLTKADYERAQHIIVSAQGLGHVHEQIEKQLLELCPPEQVRVVTHNFLVAALLVERSNFIATVPIGVAESLGSGHRVRIVEPAINLPSFKVKLYWHERFHRDPANEWLRHSISASLDGVRKR